MLVLAGKNNIAVEALHLIIARYGKQFCVVCNRTDDGVHRWQRSLKKEADENGIPIITLDAAYRDATTFISLEFDRIVRPERFLQAQAYNIHFSLLPKYKGMYTSVWPLLNDEKRTGVTLHRIDPGIDTGPIIAQREIAIGDADRARDLYRKYLDAGFKLFSENLNNITNGSCTATEQPSFASSYYSKSSVDFADISIDTNKTAHEIRKQIYAYSFREYQLPLLYGRRVVEARVLDERSSNRPGEVLIKTARYLEIATVDYDLRLYCDGIHRLNELGSCTPNEAADILTGLCGIHDRNEHGWSPIIVAAYHGNMDVLAYLLRHGANPNDTNYKGTSVLMYAKEYCIRQRDNGLFVCLVKQGADINHRDFSGNALIDYLGNDDAELLGL